MRSTKTVKATTFIGAIIVAIAFLLSIILIMNWMLASQQTYYMKPMVILKDLNANLTTGNINITLLNVGKSSTIIEKVIIHDLTNDVHYIVYTNGCILDPSSRGPESIVGYASFSDTIIRSGEIVRIRLYFTNTTLGNSIIGLIVLTDDIVVFVVS